MTRRRGAGGGSGGGGSDAVGGGGASDTRDVVPDTSYETGENGHRIAYDPRDLNESAERSKQPKLTLMEEVLLLGIKDREVRTPKSLFSLRLVTPSLYMCVCVCRGLLKGIVLNSVLTPHL